MSDLSDYVTLKGQILFKLSDVTFSNIFCCKVYLYYSVMQIVAFGNFLHKFTTFYLSLKYEPLFIAFQRAKSYNLQF